jgi:protein-S-isoprenylcysteine O-methyltransferase Ste14
MRPVVLLCLLNFALIGALPRIFFKRGTLNRSWWLTATPLFAMAVVLLARLMTGDAGRTAALWPAAVVLALCSIALIRAAVGVHRVPLALWHQANDRAQQLVTRGPYALVRHPFYSAFLLALVAAVAAAPSLLALAIAVVGAVQLYRTARGEERRLRAQFGRAYVAYMRRTGRFLPRLRRVQSYATP